MSADGEILTNAHVVEGTSEIRVRLPGETEPRTAELLAADVGNDLALLKIDATDLPPVTFAPSDEVAIGDEVVAIGFALDLAGDPSVTLGIVSALDRTIITRQRRPRRPDPDRRGDLVGQLRRSAGRRQRAGGRHQHGRRPQRRHDGGHQRRLRHRRRRGRRRCSPRCASARAATPAQEGYLGINLEERSDGGQGAVITAIEEDSPAAEAGLETGDVVIAVDESVTDGVAGVIAAVRDHEPGDEVEVVIVRDGEQESFTIVLAERPEADD